MMRDLLTAVPLLGMLALCGCEREQGEAAIIVALSLLTTAIIMTPIGLWWVHRELIGLRGDIRVVGATQAAVERRDASSAAVALR